MVQRYGDGIVGGSETACRQFAEQLAGRGHEVSVLTSCARNYVDWADEYPPGTEQLNGVTVTRLPVVERRVASDFDPVHSWMMRHPRLAPRADQIRWARLMGPRLAGQREWLTRHAHEFDVTVFMTYLYSTTTEGLPTVAGRTPTILQPTAHDEPAAYVDWFVSLFRQPDAFLFFTPEEREIVRRLYRVETPGQVAGIGVARAPVVRNPDTLITSMGLQKNKYLVYVGRIDESKGVGELLRFFRAFRSRTDSDLKLVLVGEAVMDTGDDPAVVIAGFLSEEDKASIISQSLALVQPSYFESFSIVLCEAWRNARPALVQGKCAVLRGQALRSNGALPYEGFAEFEACLAWLTQNPALADEMGAAGHDYVERNYEWDVVLRRFEETAELAKARFRTRAAITAPRISG